MIIQLERLEDGSRRVVAITEVQRMESDIITLQDLYEFKIEQVMQDRTVLGQLHPTGLRPNFVHKFLKRGIELPPTMFSGNGHGPTNNGGKR
jgi:pilus assembly protein CpaF